MADLSSELFEASCIVGSSFRVVDVEPIRNDALQKLFGANPEVQSDRRVTPGFSVCAAPPNSEERVVFV